MAYLSLHQISGFCDHFHRVNLSCCISFSVFSLLIGSLCLLWQRFVFLGWYRKSCFIFLTSFKGLLVITRTILFQICSPCVSHEFLFLSFMTMSSSGTDNVEGVITTASMFYFLFYFLFFILLLLLLLLCFFILAFGICSIFSHSLICCLSSLAKFSSKRFTGFHYPKLTIYLFY